MTNKTVVQPLAVSVKGAAEMVGVHPRTVWALVAKGVFPKPIKLSPGCTRWRVADLEAWLEKAGEATA